MRALEQHRFAAGMSSLEAMEAAGGAVAVEIVRRWPGAGRAVVLCGPGNNGGDGFVCARHLHAAGWSVIVGAWNPQPAGAGDAATMRARWHDPVLPLDAALAAIDSATVVVDALFGIGFTRPLEHDRVAAIATACAPERAAAVVAIDLPSGIDADSGRVVSDLLIADLTVTFGELKCCHVLHPGRARCGEIVRAAIGLVATADDLTALDIRLGLVPPPRISRPGATDHKFSRGHALVASGGPAATGAARLAARAALRVGAGLVTVLSPADALIVNAAQLTAVMVRLADTPAELAGHLAEPRAAALLIGPGFGVGARTREAVLALLAQAKPLVLDADALTSFADTPDDLFAAIRGPVVLTPHEGEFHRLFPDLSGEPDKIARARAAAARSGAVVLLKGPDTVIAAPDGRALVNVHATPELATAGSGDVLAGLIVGLLAEPGVRAADLLDLVGAAVWLHGEAGLRCGPGLIAEDLPEALPAVLAALPDAPRGERAGVGQRGVSGAQ